MARAFCLGSHPFVRDPRARRALRARAAAVTTTEAARVVWHSQTSPIQLRAVRASSSERNAGRRARRAGARRSTSMIVLTALLGLLAAVLLLPTVSDLLSLFRLARGKRSSAQPPAEPPRLLFLVPAHNEERMIESCVRSLLNQQYPERFTAVVMTPSSPQWRRSLPRRITASRMH